MIKKRLRFIPTFQIIGPQKYKYFYFFKYVNFVQNAKLSTLNLSDVNRPAKSATPGLGRFEPSRFSQI